MGRCPRRIVQAPTLEEEEKRDKEEEKDVDGVEQEGGSLRERPVYVMALRACW